MPVKINQIDLQLEPNHFSNASNSSPSKASGMNQLEQNNLNLEKNVMNTQSQLFKKHQPARITNMYGKI